METPGKKRKKFSGWLILLILLAVWALKNFVVESFHLSSDQMAATLLKNEHIFVGKWSYGLRLPITPLAVPFFGDTLPLIRKAAYLRNWQLPCIRLGSRTAERNDIVVFNHPHPPLRITPIDRRKICIGRCVGLPGDTIVMSAGQLSVNGKPFVRPPHAVGLYLYPDSIDNTVERLLRKYGIQHIEKKTAGNNRLCFLSRFDHFRLSRELPDTGLIRPVYTSKDNIRIILPARNRVFRITPGNIAQLYPLIVLHENANVEMKNGKLYLEGRPIEYFLFKQDYYWMLSDQIEKGIDSRKFGPVPQSHLIGKGWLIWSSRDENKPFLHGFRTDRILKKVD